MEHTSPHKYIKNTSANKTVLTEHLLNTSRIPWALKRTRKIPWQAVGWKKDKRKEKTEWDLHPWGEGVEGEERVPHLGKTPRWLGDQLGQEGSLGGSEDSAEAHLWQAGQSEMYTDGPCHSASCPSLRGMSAVGVPLPTWVSTRGQLLHQPLQQTPVGGWHKEVGLKPQLSPRSCATKEEELKSLLVMLFMDLHPSCQLCKLSACGTSEWMSTPVAETGLALAAVGFGHIPIGIGPGQNHSCHLSSHSRGMIRVNDSWSSGTWL